MRNEKSYQAIDCKAIICEGLSKWIDFEKLSNKIVAVVSTMEVPLLQEIDESKLYSSANQSKTSWSSLRLEA